MFVLVGEGIDEDKYVTIGNKHAGMNKKFLQSNKKVSQSFTWINKMNALMHGGASVIGVGQQRANAVSFQKIDMELR